jgi:hypothetical protein
MPPARRRSARQAPDSAEGVAGGVVRVYEHNVRMVRALAETYGFQALYYWQPNLLVKESLTEADRRSLQMGAIPYEGQALLRRFFLAVQRDLEESAFLRETGAFHNLGRMFAGSAEGSLFDSCHLSEEANGLVGDEIYRDIRALPAARDSRSTSAATAGSPHARATPATQSHVLRRGAKS